MAANSGMYFDYNGARYYTGAVFKCYNFFAPKSEHKTVEVEFLQSFNNGEKCFVKEKNQGWQHICEMNDFKKNIISVTENYGNEKLNLKNKQYENNKKFYHYVDDGEDFYTYKDEGYYSGWVWYILIMLFLTITNEAVVGWIFTTIIFVAWRNKKLKGE